MERGLEKLNYTKKENVDYGSVKISDHAVAMIAGMAACEIKGVSGMAGNVGNDLLTRVGIRTIAKGTKVDIEGNDAKINVAIVVEYGFNIPSVSAKVQDKVKQTIESMTGLNVTDVNVRIAGVNVESK